MTASQLQVSFNRRRGMISVRRHSTFRMQMESIIMSDPTTPQNPPTIPDAPSPNQPADLPDVGQPEPEPDQQGGATGK
ncbi:hypothetical protein [Caballeronia concitans]|nr:hypothetical protein [Caballeronia concitans]